ncbi:hypothetical protein Tco_1388774, partial [Tanacetum coccineum]
KISHQYLAKQTRINTGKLNVEDFKELTNFVAAQQGKYFAKCFNWMKECEQKPKGPLRFRDTGGHRFKPFRYMHLGQFVPLGGEQTAA